MSLLSNCCGAAPWGETHEQDDGTIEGICGDPKCHEHCTFEEEEPNNEQPVPIWAQRLGFTCVEQADGFREANPIVRKK